MKIFIEMKTELVIKIGDVIVTDSRFNIPDNYQQFYIIKGNESQVMNHFFQGRGLSSNTIKQSWI